MQLFLDYNLIYILSLVALSPILPSSLPQQYFPSHIAITHLAQLIQVPAVQSSTAYWIALASYILTSLIWLLGVCVWRNIGVWRRLWEGGNGEIEGIYRNAA